MLFCNHQLDQRQLNALNTLAALCRTVDKGVPSLYPHILIQKRITENNVFYFQGNELLGFLSVFFFYTDACEVSVLVAPKYRRQGIARLLLQSILPLLRAMQMKAIIFSTPAQVNDHWLSQSAFLYQNSEHHMQRHSYEPILTTQHLLAIRRATITDIPALCMIDERCFKKKHENMMTRFAHLLGDEHYTLFIASHDEPMGKAHLLWQPEGALLSDIAIIPPYQGQGLGSELLAYCINYALTEGKTKLALDVETSNQNALTLYIRHGFKSVNATDYWSISLDQLQILLDKIVSRSNNTRDST